MHTDALGSPVAYTSSTGSVLAGRRTQYEPYGTPTTTPRNGEPSYTGHQYDQTTGLIYAQARFYDPTLGRFLSPDPMAVDTTSAFNFNRYAYAANSPYKFTDPDGRCIDACIVEGIVLTGIVKAAIFVGTAALAAYAGSEAINAYNETASDSATPQAPVEAPKNEKEAGERVKGLVGEQPTTDTVKELENKGWDWKGKPGEAVGSSKGAFVNPQTGEQVHNDLDSHKSGTDRGPHVTYTDKDGNRWDYFPETDSTVKQ